MTGDGDLIELRNAYPIVTPRELIGRLEADQ